MMPKTPQIIPKLPPKATILAQFLDPRGVVGLQGGLQIPPDLQKTPQKPKNGAKMEPTDPQKLLHNCPKIVPKYTYT